MVPELGKWGKIALILNAAKGEGDVHRDRDACKYKWSTLLSDFKKIWDYHGRTGMNEESYFKDTTAAEKKLHKLPKSFLPVAYRNMAEWLRDKATLNPPHARDTMNPDDRNYCPPQSQVSAHDLDELDCYAEESWPARNGGINSPIPLTSTDSPAVSEAQSQRGQTPRGRADQYPSPPVHTSSTADYGRTGQTFRSPRRMMEDINLNAPPTAVNSPHQIPPGQYPPTTGRGVTPPGVGSAPAGSVPPVSRQGRRPDEIHVLSSSATSTAAELRRTMGSTGHRKKRTVESSVLAEGVTQSAEKMVQVLKDINDTQNRTEKEKLDVHTRHFHEQLEYKRDRDRQQQENMRISQEHTRLG